MAKADLPRVAILGAGPIGLEAALQARARKLPFTVYERGRVADFMLRWGHVKLFSPFALNATPLGLDAIKAGKPAHLLPASDACITGREHVAAYLVPLAEIMQANVQLETTVLLVGRRGYLKTELPGDAKRAKNPFRLLLRDKKGDRYEEADVVLDCTGTYGQHRWLGEGGLPALGELANEANIAYWFEDVLGERRNIYANKNILLVGTGYSAATTACNLAQLAAEAPATWVTWIGRGPGSQPLKRIPNDPLKERDRLAARANTLATRSDDNVEFHAQTIVEAIEFFGPDKGFKVTTRSAGKPRVWEVDRMIANVGFLPERNLSRELQVVECPFTQAPIARGEPGASATGGRPKQIAAGVDLLKNPEPNYFILGAKSYGRDSSFLLRVGFEQVREVFTLIGN